MRSILYIQKRAWINRIKRALYKPGTYVYIVLFGFYIFLIGTTISQGTDFLKTIGLNTPLTFAAFYSALLLYLTPPSYVSYAKHKGLVYIPADVQFVFSAPISPKKVLVYAYLKNVPVSIIVGILVAAVGVIWFQVPLWKGICFFLVIGVAEHVMMAALTICLYGNERFAEKTTKRFGRILYLVLAGLVGVAAYYLYVNGLHVSTVISYLSSPWLQLVPLIGWQIAVMRLILVGPALFTVIGSCLYVLAFAAFVILAWKMKCTGEYYEDAMTFADDYQKALDKQKKGDTTLNIKPGKLRRASIRYQGGGAKAVFYRQLLEYKKRRFFLFGGRTLTALIIGAGAVVLFSMGEISVSGAGRYYTVPGILGYLAFIFSTVGGKWEKELENPYIYLIPDTPFKKLWYATLLDHVRTAVDGLLISAPIVLYLGMPWWYIVIFTLFAVLMQAARLYADTVANALIGNSLGNVARQFLNMGIFLLVVGIVVPIMILVHIFAGPLPALLAGCLYFAAAAGALMAGGAMCFVRMEMKE